MFTKIANSITATSMNGSDTDLSTNAMIRKTSPIETVLTTWKSWFVIFRVEFYSTDEATFRSVNFLATTKPATNAIVKQVTKAIKLIINFHLSMLIIFHYQRYSL